MNIILIPAFEEYDNLKILIPQVLDKISSTDIILIVDALPNFAKWKDLGFFDSKQVLHLPQTGFGLGAALKQGMKYGLQIGVNKIVTMDADFSHNPKLLPTLLESSLKFDLVIGSRYVSGGGFQGGIYRRLISKIGNRLITLFFNSSVRDMTSNYRCYSANIISKSLPQFNKLSNGYGFLFDLFVFLNNRNISVSEIPIVLEPRRFGNTKLTYKEILKSAVLILKIKVRDMLTV